MSKPITCRRCGAAVIKVWTEEPCSVQRTLDAAPTTATAALAAIVAGGGAAIRHSAAKATDWVDVDRYSIPTLAAQRRPIHTRHTCGQVWPDATPPPTPRHVIDGPCPY